MILSLKKKIRFLTPVLVFLIILSVVTGAFYKNPQLFQSLNLQNFVAKKSTANLTVEGNNLKIDFEISEGERKDVEAFSDSLGVSSLWSEGIRIGLNKEAVDKLKKITPTSATLDFSDKGVKFGNNSLTLSLQSALPGEDIKYSTGSSIMGLKYNNPDDFVLKLTQPKDLLNEATKSGKLRYSPKIEVIFPIAEKIATMEIRVRNKSISGEIILK